MITPHLLKRRPLPQLRQCCLIAGRLLSLQNLQHEGPLRTRQPECKVTSVGSRSLTPSSQAEFTRGTLWAHLKHQTASALATLGTAPQGHLRHTPPDAPRHVTHAARALS